jgi:hypothetical protein
MKKALYALEHYRGAILNSDIGVVKAQMQFLKDKDTYNFYVRSLRKIVRYLENPRNRVKICYPGVSWRAIYQWVVPDTIGYYNPVHDATGSFNLTPNWLNKETEEGKTETMIWEFGARSILGLTGGSWQNPTLGNNEDPARFSHLVKNLNGVYNQLKEEYRQNMSIERRQLILLFYRNPDTRGFLSEDDLEIAREIFQWYPDILNPEKSLFAP